MSGWPDLLRREPFGGLYFSRATGLFHPLEPLEADLLFAATQDSVVNAFARMEPPPLSEADFGRLVTRWRRRGILSADLTCPAEPVQVAGDGPWLSAPLITHVQLTRACNLRCTHCYLERSPGSRAAEGSLDEWDQLFAELRAMGSPVVRLAGGEPLARPDILAIVQRACARQLDIKLCTNGVGIDAALAAELTRLPIRLFSVSLDGADAPTHEALRGAGSFERACRGIQLLTQRGAHVLLRATVTRQSAASVGRFAELGARLGVDMVGLKPYRLSGPLETHGHLEPSPQDWGALCEQLLETWPADAPRLLLSTGLASPPLPAAGSRHRSGLSCPGGTESITVLPDLRVAACGAVADEEMWSLRAHALAECWQRAPNLAAWRSLAPEEPCRSCADLDRCSGGCRARARHATGSLTGLDDWCCESYRADQTD